MVFKGRSVLCQRNQNKIHSVLFGMQNRTIGPSLATTNRTLIPVMRLHAWPPGSTPNGIHSVLFDIQNRMLGPYWAVTNRSLIPVTRMAAWGAQVVGVATNDFGVARDGSRKPAFAPGVELRARATLLAEGCRGSLSEVCHAV
jgi:hypothetical protein